MFNCNICTEPIDEDDVLYECPYCGKTDEGEGFYICENCETLIDFEGNEWVCVFCENEGIASMESGDMWECPECGALNDESSECCEECGCLADVNSGWVGENC